MPLSLGVVAAKGTMRRVPASARVHARSFRSRRLLRARFRKASYDGRQHERVERFPPSPVQMARKTAEPGTGGQINASQTSARPLGAPLPVLTRIRRPSPARLIVVGIPCCCISGCKSGTFGAILIVVPWWAAPSAKVHKKATACRRKAKYAKSDFGPGSGPSQDGPPFWFLSGGGPAFGVDWQFHVPALADEACP